MAQPSLAQEIPGPQVRKSRSFKKLGLIVLSAIAAWVVLILVHFPFDTDAETAPRQFRKEFYNAIYTKVQTAPGLNYVDAAASGFPANIKALGEFVKQFNLEKAKVLEVGSGSGYLQDVVADYTGLDIAESAARFYHKPFVQGSATELPFPDNSFDSVWTVWALEHVPNPSLAFQEIRRVVKPGGMIYMAPAFNVPTWAPAGYAVRPYGDLDFAGKLQKATIPLRDTYAFKALYKIPTRLGFELAYQVRHKPTALHYIRLNPSDTYWQSDSDASNSFDTQQVELWYRSRGDECMNCKNLTWRASFPLFIKVSKN